MNVFILGFALFGTGIYFYLKQPTINNEELDTVTAFNSGLGYQASKIDFKTVEGFSETEFQGQLHLLDAQVVFMLVKLRAKIGRIKISPAHGAIARTTGSKTTMHYADLSIDKLSLAIDIMPLDVDLKTAYEAAKTIREIGGIGLYPDWQPMAGLHLDLRKKTNGLALWAGLKINGKQVYRGINEALA